jgi:hypothetical protein
MVRVWESNIFGYMAELPAPEELVFTLLAN